MARRDSEDEPPIRNRRRKVRKPNPKRLTADARRAMLMATFGAQEGRCAYCDAALTTQSPLDNWYRATLDHVVPLSRGGTNDPDNFVVACKPCNEAKGSMLPLEFVLWRLRRRREVA